TSAIDQSPVRGLTRVIRIEHPELTCISVDLDRVDVAAQASSLLEELTSDGNEDQVAVRNDVRYVARLTPLGDRQHRDTEIRADATYLITGGMGGLGLCVAEWLVQHGARSIMLVGRRGPSAEAEQAIAALQTGGANVVVRAGDVSIIKDVTSLI